MHVSNTHLYSPNSACAWGFLLCLRVGSPLAKTCSLPICFEIQHCSSPGCLSHGVQIEKDALSTAASQQPPSPASNSLWIRISRRRPATRVHRPSTQNTHCRRALRAKRPSTTQTGLARLPIACISRFAVVAYLPRLA